MLRGFNHPHFALFSPKSLTSKAQFLMAGSNASAAVAAKGLADPPAAWMLLGSWGSVLQAQLPLMPTGEIFSLKYSQIAPRFGFCNKWLLMQSSFLVNQYSFPSRFSRTPATSRGIFVPSMLGLVLMRVQSVAKPLPLLQASNSINTSTAVSNLLYVSLQQVFGSVLFLLW